MESTTNWKKLSCFSLVLVLPHERAQTNKYVRGVESNYSESFYHGESMKEENKNVYLSMSALHFVVVWGKFEKQ